MCAFYWTVGVPARPPQETLRWLEEVTAAGGRRAMWRIKLPMWAEWISVHNLWAEWISASGLGVVRAGPQLLPDCEAAGSGRLTRAVPLRQKYFKIEKMSIFFF